MNKQEIEKAICVMENLKYLLIDVLGNKNNEKEFDVAIEMLEKQLANGWIPVSERLPEEGRYLVTTVYGEVKESEFDLKKWWQIDNSTISLVWEEEPIKVVAWQPLPEPYKELATDNNVVTKSGKDNNVLTIGDKIRESNRSLAYMLGSLCSHGTTDIKTFEMRGWTTKKWLDYLNQPYME